jgi:Cu/Ag efflux pump CusA
MYVSFDINREAAARYGLTVGDVQDVIQSAIGLYPFHSLRLAWFF